MPAGKPIMPRGIINAYFFQILNSASWSIVLGTSLLLYLKELGASGMVLGIAVALAPLFAALQIPAAEFAERIGYKPFMIRGWSLRSIFILGAAFVPLLPEAVSPGLRIKLILGLLTCFALARGISVCGYMPWLTMLIPENKRGRFIAIDTMCINISVAGTMLLSSLLLRWFPNTRTYAILFGFSYIAAIGSLHFLKRIPAVIVPRPQQNKTARPSWLTMLRYPPFSRYVRFNICHNVFFSGMGVVWVPFIRDGLKISPSMIMGLSSFASAVAMIISFVIGPITDRVGSRPLLACAGGLIVLYLTAWWSLASGLMPHSMWLPFLIVTISATGLTIFQIANTRLAMVTIPQERRSHYFAISSVANSLVLGFMPLFWGWIMDHLPQSDTAIFGKFSLLYGIFIIGIIATQFMRRRLLEPYAMTTREFFHILLIASPRTTLQKVISQLRRPDAIQH